MKKIKYSILALFLCFVMLLTSCGGDKSQNAQNIPTQPNQSVGQNEGVNNNSQSANNIATTCQNGHKVVTDKAVSPTCTEAGLTKGSHCSVCNEVIVKQETIKPNGHSMVADDKVDATCTQSGLTSGAHCIICNEIMIAQKETPQLEHNYTNWMVRNESTCASFGVEYRTCNSCKKEETREIALNPHATMIWVTEKVATCTENGTKAKKCSACLTTFETQTISSLGHSWKDATCTAPKTCSSCKITQGSALEHNWIAETCETPQICPDCGKVGNSEKSHAFDNYECTVCGTKNSISVSKYDDNEIFYAFANSKLKINFSNFKADSLQIKEDDNTVYSASMTNVITTSLPSGAYVVSLTYYNSYETVQRLMRNPDGSYGYQYVTQGVGSEYSLVFGLVISNSNADSTYHSWYVKDYISATCLDSGKVTIACYTCSQVVTKIVPAFDHNDVDLDHKCDKCNDIISECIDTDKNHSCDKCKENVGEHFDASNDENHNCDYCDSIITFCEDMNKDHFCDECQMASQHTFMGGSCTFCGVEQYYVRNGNKISFGSYPQSEVTNSDLKSILNNKAGTLPTSVDSQAWTSYGYYISGEVNNFMWYIDIEYSSEKYRGVYFISYRPSSPSSESPSAVASKQDLNGYVTYTTYWFKYEPVFWTILSENISEGTAFILCNVMIDAQQFDFDSDDYATSTIRKWLNDTFYNTAFEELQKEMIITTSISADIEDSIFLISREDIGNSEYLQNTNSRIKNPTNYAQAQGAYIVDRSGYIGNGWWTRSSGSKGFVWTVYCTGATNRTFSVNQTCAGVVPALQIRL